MIESPTTVTATELARAAIRSGWERAVTGVTAAAVAHASYGRAWTSGAAAGTELGDSTRVGGSAIRLAVGVAGMIRRGPPRKRPARGARPQPPAQRPVGTPLTDQRGAVRSAEDAANPCLRIGSSTKRHESAAIATVAPTWARVSSGPAVPSTGEVSTMIG